MNNLCFGKNMRSCRWKCWFLAIGSYFPRYCDYALCHPQEAPTFSHLKDTTGGTQCLVEISSHNY